MHRTVHASPPPRVIVRSYLNCPSPACQWRTTKDNTVMCCCLYAADGRRFVVVCGLWVGCGEHWGQRAAGGRGVSPGVTSPGRGRARWLLALGGGEPWGGEPCGERMGWDESIGVWFHLEQNVW